MMNFCIKCGAKNKELINNLCEDCFWDEKLVDIPSEINLILCSSCTSYLHGKKWIKKKDFDSLLNESIITELKKKLSKNILLKNIEILRDERIPNKILIRVEISIDNISKKIEVLGNISYRKCNYCQAVSTGKYKTIVQIRNINEEYLEKIKSIIEEFHSFNGRIEISEVKELKEGINIKFMSISKARLFAKKISSITGAKIIETAKTIGYKRGEPNYIITISIRLPIRNIGEIISIEDKIYKILGIVKGKILVQNLETNKKILLDYKEIEKAEKIESKKVRIEAKKGKFVTLLDMENKYFIDVPIEEIKENLKEGDYGILINFKGKEKIIKI